MKKISKKEHQENIIRLALSAAGIASDPRQCYVIRRIIKEIKNAGNYEKLDLKTISKISHDSYIKYPNHEIVVDMIKTDVIETVNEDFSERFTRAFERIEALEKPKRSRVKPKTEIIEPPIFPVESELTPEQLNQIHD